MITTALGGHLVKMGAGYGKVFSSQRFQSFPRLFIAFLIEAVLLAVVFEWIQPWLTQVLLSNLSILVSIVVEAFVVYYFWFCVTFNFSPRWKAWLLPQIIVALNLGLGIGSLAFLGR
jgi:phosphoglycerol transferase MdoB-like AlkP superfamily enzyme